MRQQRSSAERPARAPPPIKTHPTPKPGQGAEDKAEAVWQRFKGQPRQAPDAPPVKEAVLSVAQAIVGAGPSAATAAAIMRAEPAVLLAPPATVAAKMRSLAPLAAGRCASVCAGRRRCAEVQHGRGSSPLCPCTLASPRLPLLYPRSRRCRRHQEPAGAVPAAGPGGGTHCRAGAGGCRVWGRLPAAGELVVAARPVSRHTQHDKAWGVLRDCEAAHLTTLLCDHSAAELRRLLVALHRDLAWSAPQAAAALLGLDGTGQAAAACPRLAAASPDGVAALGSLLRCGAGSWGFIWRVPLVPIQSQAAPACLCPPGPPACLLGWRRQRLLD